MKSAQEKILFLSNRLGWADLITMAQDVNDGMAQKMV